MNERKCFIMDAINDPTTNRRRIWLFAILTLLLIAASVGCQSNAGAIDPSQREASATHAPTPVPTATSTAALKTPAVTPPSPTVVSQASQSVPPAAPAPVTTPGRPRSEMDAASKVIPITKENLPKGVRKPPPNRLIIPSIGVDIKVIELGTHYNEQGELVWDTAPFAAGHHIGTANPGEPGNVVMSGHISSIHEGAVFKRLPDIKVGDGVVVVTNDRDYVYQVFDKKVVEPTQVEVMNSTSQEILTIITCVPDGVYSHRLIVTARRI